MKEKKLIAWLLALALLLPCLPTTALAGSRTAYVLTGQGEDDVVAVALAQVGKTGRDLGYSYEWCASFVTWVGRTARQNYPTMDLYTPKAVAEWFINNGAGTFYCFRKENYDSLSLSGTASRDAYVLTNRSAVVPRKGDLVCYLWPHDIEAGYNWSHIGILVEDYEGGTLRSVEGNTGSLDSLYDRCVLIQGRAYDASVVGIIRPAYTAAVHSRTVKHYLENYGGGYFLKETETVTPAGSEFTVEDALSALRTYDGYGRPDLKDILSSVRQEGDLEFYYPRLYTLTVIAGEGVSSVSGSGQYGAGTDVTIAAQTLPGYRLSWPSVSSSKQDGSALILTMPAQDIRLEVSATEIPHVGPFLDVAPDAWYAENVAKVYELNLMRGTAADAFSPQRGVTIAEAVTLAARLYSGWAGDEAAFAAVEGEPWYAPYASYAEEKGLVWADCDYTAVSTRGDFARILGRALPEEALEALWDVPAFADLDGDALTGEVELLCRAGVLAGEAADGALYFRPDRSITRAEAAAVAARMADPALRLRPAEG